MMGRLVIATAFLSMGLRGSTPDPTEADLFCREVTQNEGSYCKSDHDPPTCYGTIITCSAEDIITHRNTMGRRVVVSEESSSLVNYESITTQQQDQYCRLRAAGSYCKISYASSNCHISNVDCSKRTVFLALNPGAAGSGSNGRTTVRPSTSGKRTAATTSSSTLVESLRPSTTPSASTETTTTETTTAPPVTTLNAQDPCSFIDAERVGRTPTSGDSYYMPLSSLRVCMLNTKITHGNAIWTLHNLLYGVAETYSFTELVKDTLASNQTNACNHQVHPVRVDLVSEIKSQLRAYKTLFSGMTKNETDAYLLQERSAYEFHRDLVILMNRLHDAHTLYATPYTMFRVYSPINFGSRVDDSTGQQLITLRASVDSNDPLGRLQSVYSRIYGSFPITAEKIGATIALINGMPAIDFIKFLTSEVGLLAASYQQQEQRMNAFIFSTPVLAFGQVLSYLPDFESLSLTFADGSTAEFRLLGQFEDLSTSPYYSAPDLRSSATLSAYLHSNDAFNAFISHEENVDVKKPSLWKSVTAGASQRAGTVSASSAARMRLLSKRHKALLDPIKNLRRDNLLNIPIEEDMMIEDGPSAARAPFVDAPTLARVIKDAQHRSSSCGGVACTAGPELDMMSPSYELNFITDNAMSYAILGDTIIVKIPTFSLDPPASGGEDYYYFPEFVRIQRVAKAANIRRILFDLTDNGGGYIMSAYAMLWYMMSDQSRICSPLHQRLTPSWQLWIESFGNGPQAIVSRYLRPLGDDLADKIESIFAEVSSIVTILFDGLSLPKDYLGSFTKTAVLERVARAKARILAMRNKRARADAIRDYLGKIEYIPEDLPGRSTLIPEGGLSPFYPTEMVVPDSRGRPFRPSMSNYRNIVRKRWGPIGTSVSQLGEFSYCYDTIMYMPTIAAGYDRNWFKQVAIVTDGTCGSACSQFSTVLTTNGDAVAFTYGGQANKAMDISSFCGGNVFEYEEVMQPTALSRRIASLSSQRLSPYDLAHNETFVDSFVPMPTKATTRMNWNMAMMETHMSRSQDGSRGEDYSFDPLPRQMYLVPARRHINKWAFDDLSRMAVYEDIIAISNWDSIEPQFSSTHGICPKEILSATTQRPPGRRR